MVSKKLATGMFMPNTDPHFLHKTSCLYVRGENRRKEKKKKKTEVKEAREYVCFAFVVLDNSLVQKT